jgi:Holliday junction resolvase
MKRTYGCVCIRSAGSHTPCDLICGNTANIYVVQVKYGDVKPYVDWKTLKEFAKWFKAVPLVLWRRKFKGFLEIRE